MGAGIVIVSFWAGCDGGIGDTTDEGDGTDGEKGLIWSSQSRRLFDAIMSLHG